MKDAEQIKVVVLINDIHAGSTWALLPPGFETNEWQPIGQNAVQKWFWDCWERAHAGLAESFKPGEYAVIFNGDLIEGNHHRTTEIISPDAANHVKAAIELLTPVAQRAAMTFVVRGTECHVGSAELAIAKAIGAEVNPEFNQPYWDRLDADICGKRLSVCHHMPATTRSYLEGSAMSIMLGNAVNEAVRAGDRPPDILALAHRHRHGEFCDGNRLVIVPGAWQGLTRHGTKVVPHARPCPSIVALDFRESKPGELPRIHRWRFNPAQTKAVCL